MEENLSSKIAVAVADEKGVDPVEMDLTLAEHVDVDALSRLARRDDCTWLFSFELPEHTVTVTSDRTVSLTDRREESIAEGTE